MKLYQLVETTQWPDVWERFVTLYPGYVNAKSLCHEVYNELKTKSPLNSQITLKLMSSRAFGANRNTGSVDIMGILPNNDLDYGIEFSSSEEWLGMEVDFGTISSFSNSEIIAHCLFGLSGIGYVPVQIPVRSNSRAVAHHG